MTDEEAISHIFYAARSLAHFCEEQKTISFGSDYDIETGKLIRDSIAHLTLRVQDESMPQNIKTALKKYLVGYWQETGGVR